MTSSSSSSFQQASNSPPPANVADVLNYYNDNFTIIFAHAVAVSGQFPEQILNELRNTLDHLAKANSGLAPSENIKKAKNHIDRSCLDCAKIVWLEIGEQAKLLFDSYKPRDYILVDNGKFWEEVYNLHESFMKTSYNARLKESSSVEDSVSEALNLYYEAIEEGIQLSEIISTRASDIHHQRLLFRRDSIIKNGSWAVAGAVLSFILTKCFL